MDKMDKNSAERPEKKQVDLYFVGIGGISMYGLAELAAKAGHTVAGSDNHNSPRLDSLRNMGITVFSRQVPENIVNIHPTTVVRTAAVPPDNPEVVTAETLGIPVLDRGEYLGKLTYKYKNVYNIAGTHGKTTTTAMLTTIFMMADKKPNVHIGAELPMFGGNTVHYEPQSELLVSEACEYANSFLHMRSKAAAVLNIDADHLDFFHDVPTLVDSFVDFVNKIDPDGFLVCAAAGKYMPLFRTKLAAKLNKPLHIITFAVRDEAENIQTTTDTLHAADYVAVDVNYQPNGCPEFKVIRPNGRKALNIALNVPGKHNIANALAAIALADLENISDEVYVKAFREFTGAEGRFSIKGKFKGALVVADYAHHPTATKATLAAAAHLPHNNIWVVYQPLTYNRVKILFDEYIKALLPVREVLLYEIYSDREKSTEGMSSKLLADALNAAGGNAGFYRSFADIKARLSEIVQANDIILFLGPEEIRSFAPRLVRENTDDIKAKF